MSKEAEARVRDELLQQLYAAMLRAQLTAARDRVAGDTTTSREALAMCAGVCANLQLPDLVLLPRRGGAGLRALRNGSAGERDRPSVGELRGGTFTMPRDEAAAVAFTLGAASAHAHTSAGTVVCALVSASSGRPAASRRRSESGELPTSWAAAGDFAAKLALPLLLLSDQLTPQRTVADEKPAHLLPAPAYPSIPVDRDDALAIYRVAFECATRARAGMGPSHIQCVPFRLRGEREQGKQQTQPEALARLEAMLRRRGAFSKAWRRQLERKLIRELSG